MIKKAKIQAEANAAIDANNGFGLIAMATGTGEIKNRCRQSI